MYVCTVCGMLTSGSTLYEHNMYVCMYKFVFINNTFLSIMYVCTVCMYCMWNAYLWQHIRRYLAGEIYRRFKQAGILIAAGTISQSLLDLPR